jgi:hypothetical protein
MSKAHVQQLREAEGHDFGHAQLAATVEGDVEVDVHNAPAPRLQQHVVQVPVAQPQQVAHLPSHTIQTSFRYATTRPTVPRTLHYPPGNPEGRQVELYVKDLAR